MGWVKIVQSILFYIAACSYFLAGKPELAALFAIAACICDVTHVLEEKS